VIGAVLGYNNPGNELEGHGGQEADVVMGSPKTGLSGTEKASGQGEVGRAPKMVQSRLTS